MLEKLFKLKENNTDVRTEVLAGITTFMTMAYILAVNPSILAAAGMDQGAVFTATALASFIGTLLMAFLANYPFALAPGMGLNAYFAYTVVLGMEYKWEVALTAVFVEGIIFIILSLTNVREAIFNAIPLNLKAAVSVGIGLFIAFIGLQNANIVISGATLVELFSVEGYNLANGTAASFNDVGITVMKPYAGGRLFDEQRSPFGVPLTPVQCIHYCLTRPAVASVLAGYDTPEHVEQAVAYETAGEAEKDYASVLARAPRHTFGQGECTYCGHCRPCPVHIDIAMVNKYYDLASMQAEVPASVRAHYEALEHHADECVGCRACESRCPFGVKIADRMAEAVRLFQLAPFFA